MLLDCSQLNSAFRLQSILFSPSKKSAEWLLPCCEQHKEGFLVSHCVPLLTDEASRCAADAPRVLRCTTALVRLSSILVEFQSAQCLSESFQSQLLTHCLRFLDFPSGESVGHQCVALLMNLVELHVKSFGAHCQNDCAIKDEVCAWLLTVGRSLCGSVNDDDLLSKLRMKALLFLLVHPSANSCKLRDILMTDAFIARLYAQIGQAPLSIPISKLIVDDCCVAVRLHRSQRLNLHLEWIRTQLLSDKLNLRYSIEQKLLPALLKEPETKKWFRAEFSSIISLSPDSPYFLHALCSLFRLAIQIGDGNGDFTIGWNDFVVENSKSNFMEEALFSGNLETRLSALSLLCSHPKGARPVSERELCFVLRFVSNNFSEQSPAARQQIITQIGKLLSRIRDHSKTLLKCNEQEHLELYRQFVQSLHRMAFEHLPSCSTIIFDDESGIADDEEDKDSEEGCAEKGGFSSRLFALMLCSLLYSSEIYEIFGIHPVGYSELGKLVACLDDQFELCQDTALKLINQIDLSDEKISFNFASFLEKTKRDLLLAEPHTPRHQLAVQYRLSFLLTRLPFEDQRDFFDGLLRLGNQKCKILKNNANLFLLTRSPQLHALLSALFHTLPFILHPKWENDKNCLHLLARLLSLCHLCAELVSPVVHSLSPEGFLPEDQFSGGFENGLRAVQLLSKTCWRSHKAVSHIFSCLIDRMSFPHSLPADQLVQIGNYFWLQLTKCRHCGAFEAAAHAFRTICHRFWSFSSEFDLFLCSPKKWLQQIVDELGAKSTSNRCLCPTRRSAGLPHLVSALLCTEPPSADRQFPHFDATMQSLLRCRALRSPELEVHCVNVLRLLFSQAQLTERILSYAENAFCVTIEGCSVELWPVRNAHVQLFAALVKRIFGTPPTQQRSLHIQQRCKMSAHEFFMRHPSLYRLLGDCLRDLCQAARSRRLGARHLFSAFSVLILFTHLRPVAHEPGQAHSLRPFLPDFLCLLFTLPARPLRELASAALCSTATLHELQEILELIVEMASSAQKQCRLGFVSSTMLDSIHIFLHHIGELNLAELVNTDAFRSLAKIFDDRSKELKEWAPICGMIWDNPSPVLLLDKADE